MAIRVTLDDRASKNFLSAANTAKPLSWPSLAAPLYIGASVTFTREVILEFRKSLKTLQPTTALTPVYAAPVQSSTFADARTTAPKAVGSALTMATFHMLSFPPPHHGEQRTAFTYRTALPCRTALANRTATVAAVGASTILIGSPVFTSASEPPSQAFQPVRGERLLLPGQC